MTTQGPIGQDRHHLDASAVHRRLVAGYGDILAGRFEQLLALIDVDVIDHRGGAEGDHVGIDAWRRKWEGFASPDGPFRDNRVTVEANVSDGDTSVNRYVSTGTDRESGRTFAVTSMDMIRVRDGKVVEHWALSDAAAIGAQLSG